MFFMPFACNKRTFPSLFLAFHMSPLEIRNYKKFASKIFISSSKGCPPPDFHACRAMPEQLTIGSEFNGVKMSVNHWQCRWEKKFNGYQQMLTFVLGSAAIFAFFLFYIVQMVSKKWGCFDKILNAKSYSL